MTESYSDIGDHTHFAMDTDHTRRHFEARELDYVVHVRELGLLVWIDGVYLPRLSFPL